VTPVISICPRRCAAHCTHFVRKKAIACLHVAERDSKGRIYLCRISNPLLIAVVLTRLKANLTLRILLEKNQTLLDG
jgi:hypothetical protein